MIRIKLETIWKYSQDKVDISVQGAQSQTRHSHVLTIGMRNDSVSTEGAAGGEKMMGAIMYTIS